MLWVFLQVGLSWASREPDAIARIADGTVTVEGDMLGNVRYGWYPGQVKEGILRIQNDGQQSIWIDSLDTEVSVVNASGSEIDQNAYGHPIYTLTLSDGSDGPVSRFGGTGAPIHLSQGGFVDIDYRVAMDARCGNELQGCKARIAIYANLTGRNPCNNRQ